MRKGREDKLNRLIERKMDNPLETSRSIEKSLTDGVSSAKSMIDITFQQKKNNTFGRFPEIDLLLFV